MGIKKSKADEMLALVGLTDAANKKSSKYSLGMKQRLGIALALVSDPELLLLDEPTNGLDPNGIIEVRNLMIDLATKHNKTILVSSHLLAEIERTATHVGIINKGQLLFQGTIDELHQLSKPMLEIDVNNVEQASAFLLQSGYEIAEQTNTKIIIPFKNAKESGDLNTLLVQCGFTVSSLYQKRKDLENLFLDITKNN
ncbi:ATP-binding cassette domain-containing protein [Pedobacter jejuensis]|uniref:ATP-binding cassette domain-containing protein n=1 Tax=Pedobacter jejuensis TaxID=1268550 RepID=UPI001ABF384F|nr:ABC transporter ATP-binding protein [Pedobacter jejuensis]